MTELVKDSSTRQQNPLSAKFKLPCQSRITEKNPTTEKWLKVEQKLVNNAPILKGILERSKEVVLKYGSPDRIHHEYNISQELAGLPNFIKYYCVFTCKDDIVRNFVERPFVCSEDGAIEQGYIVMPYYSVGDMNTYTWNRVNFELLKNILRQVCYAVLYAFEQKGFIHNDLHLANILLRRTKKTTVTYGENVTLNIGPLYAIIMDFERSITRLQRIISPCDIYYEIKNILNRVSMLNNFNFRVKDDQRKLIQLIQNNTPVTKESYKIVSDTIDTLVIIGERGL